MGRLYTGVLVKKGCKGRKTLSSNAVKVKLVSNVAGYCRGGIYRLPHVKAMQLVNAGLAALVDPVDRMMSAGSYETK